MYLKSLSVIVVATATSVAAGPSFALQIETDTSPAHETSYQMLAETQGMERRQDRRDVRQEARQEEGIVGKDKRDAKQEGRQEAREERQESDSVDN